MADSQDRAERDMPDANCSTLRNSYVAKAIGDVNGAPSYMGGGNGSSQPYVATASVREVHRLDATDGCRGKWARPHKIARTIIAYIVVRTFGKPVFVSVWQASYKLATHYYSEQALEALVQDQQVALAYTLVIAAITLAICIVPVFFLHRVICKPVWVKGELQASLPGGRRKIGPEERYRRKRALRTGLVVGGLCLSLIIKLMCLAVDAGFVMSKRNRWP